MISIDLTALILLIFFHLIGDLVLQRPWIARRKAESFLILTLHAFLYILPFILLPVTHRIVFLFGIFVTHLITDFITSKINRYFLSRNKIDGFAITICIDQSIHIITLAILFIMTS